MKLVVLDWTGTITGHGRYALATAFVDSYRVGKTWEQCMQYAIWSNMTVKRAPNSHSAGSCLRRRGITASRGECWQSQEAMGLGQDRRRSRMNQADTTVRGAPFDSELGNVFNRSHAAPDELPVNRALTFVEHSRLSRRNHGEAKRW